MMQRTRTPSSPHLFALLLAACGGAESTSESPPPEPPVVGGPCTPTDCGPAPGMPHHPCSDGTTVAGPACERDAHGRCAWTIRECPPEPEAPGGGGAPAGRMCGGIQGLSCGPSETCVFAREARCGAGDQTGVCQPRPDACAEIYQPVCGCDGRTHGNECEANRAGTSVASDGECAPAATGGGGGAAGERACGSRGMAPCGPDELCDFPLDAQCGAADRPGVCRPRPRTCTRELAPVCGCDGQTHPTRCVAASQGIAVAHDGPC